MRQLSYVTTLLVIAGIMATVLVTAGCNTPDGNADQGKRWYSMHHCYNCHGENGNDGRAAEIAGLGRSFSSFEKYLRDPASASMPPFPEERLPKQDAADIYVWLKGLEK